MPIYNQHGYEIFAAFNKDGIGLSRVYDSEGQLVFPTTIPIPSGELTADLIVPLPDIYGTGHGFTCTGLAYDAGNDTFLVGDIGKALPSSPGFASKIIRVSSDFRTAIEQIDLYTQFPSMADVQGITMDRDGTIWFCSTEERMIRHIDASGNSLGSLSIADKPTGIAYSPKDDSFWVLTYASVNNIIRIDRSGNVLEQYTFAYQVTLDQCFLDITHEYLYITAGDNYSGRNNIYMFNVSTHEQSIPCSVDSYSVEGLWIGEDRMVIVNDGYYHSALTPVNQANIYYLEQ